MTKPTSKIVTMIALLALGSPAFAATATAGDQGAAAAKPAAEKKGEVKKTTAKHHVKHVRPTKPEAAAPAPAAPAAPATK